MFGNNPIRKPITGDGDVLDIVSIFPTIQGEGPRAGEPAIFIRLGGCNLACEFCDTEFEDFIKHELEDILNEVRELKNGQKLIVITGGEPFRQPIEKLCKELTTLGFTVQIETNGTLYRELSKGVEIICSPKQNSPIRGDLLERITAFKFLISEFREEYQTVPEVGQSQTDLPIYIQPIDEYDTEKKCG